MPLHSFVHAILSKMILYSLPSKNELRWKVENDWLGKLVLLDLTHPSFEYDVCNFNKFSHQHRDDDNEVDVYSVNIYHYYHMKS